MATKSKPIKYRVTDKGPPIIYPPAQFVRKGKDGLEVVEPTAEQAAELGLTLDGEVFRRVLQAGDIAEDMPPSVAAWMLEQGYIEEV